jgi:U3 small nucleolar ribonucleoprotein component
MTFHAEEEMADDNLSIFDIERVVLTGKIVERQKDKNTKEWKYRWWSSLTVGFFILKFQ